MGPFFVPLCCLVLSVLLMSVSMGTDDLQLAFLSKGGAVLVLLSAMKFLTEAGFTDKNK